MKIKDLTTGKVFHYGTNKHHALAISDDGRTLSFEHMQNGDGSEFGNYRFVDDSEEIIPSETETSQKYGSESYFNIGGFDRTNNNQKKSIFDDLREKLEMQKELYEKARKRTYCRRTETDDCDRCIADKKLENRLDTIEDIKKIINQIEQNYNKSEF